MNNYLSFWQVPFCSCPVSVCIGSLASAIQSAPSTGSAALVGPGSYLWQCGPVSYSARLLSSTSQELGDLNFPFTIPLHCIESVFNCGLFRVR